jgi:acetyl-CoA carboxylase biotin carboxyl carrier protein
MTTRFNLDELRSLIRLVKDENIHEIEVTSGDLTVRVVGQAPAAAVYAAPSATPAAAATASAPPTAAPRGPVIASPMVGTFYRSSSPSAAPFVSVGDRVKKGQVIGIIEAMKTMNQIEADRDGVVSDILVQNAQPVEFGEALIALDAAHV